MPTLFNSGYELSKTVAVTLQQCNGSTGAPIDLWWKESGSGSGNWVAGASATQAERRIALSDANSYANYTGGKSSALGTYTGYVYVYYWDTALAIPITSEKIWLSAGHQREPEQSISDVIDGGAATTISPWHVVNERTWVVERDTNACRNVVYLPEGSVVTLAMDFSRVANDGTGIASISAISDDTDGADLTIGEGAVSQDRRQAHFTVSGIVSGESHTVKVVIVTLDGDTLVGLGTLRGA